MGRISLAAALVAAALLLPATAPAAIVDATINVGPDKVLSPPNVTVSPDGTVSWKWAVGSIAHHIVSNSTTGPEVWDSGERSSGTFTHTFVHSGSFSYHCAIHPNVMRGTVTVTGALPQAQLAPPTPNPAFIGDTVSFSAAGSSDAEGPIASYRWDFGDGSPVETTPGDTPSATHTYAAAGTFTAKVTAVDDHGNTGDATRSVTVFSHSPTASFTATPASVAKNAPVAFDAAASVDHDGTITQFEWDLGDGNGFQVGTSTATMSYPSAGTVTVRLRVADDAGNTGEATQSVTVTNQAPTATLKASTTAPANGADVTFDATGSADADGTIASYQWDLDGNGVFETPGGTSPTITKRFPTAGATSVRVRVTDNDGATGDATVSVTVAAPPSPPAAPAPGPAPAPSPAPLAPLSLTTPKQVAPPKPAAAPLSVSAPSGQRLGRQRGVRIAVSCGQACALVVTGSVKAGGKRLRLSRAKKALATAGSLNLTLKVDKRDLRALKRARGKARASITVTATAGGQTLTQKLAVSLTG